MPVTPTPITEYTATEYSIAWFTPSGHGMLPGKFTTERDATAHAARLEAVYAANLAVVEPVRFSVVTTHVAVVV